MRVVFLLLEISHAFQKPETWSEWLECSCSENTQIPGRLGPCLGKVSYKLIFSELTERAGACVMFISSLPPSPPTQTSCWHVQDVRAPSRSPPPTLKFGGYGLSYHQTSCLLYFHYN